MKIKTIHITDEQDEQINRESLKLYGVQNASLFIRSLIDDYFRGKQPARKKQTTVEIEGMSQFETIWRVYGKKGSKLVAKRAWGRLSKTEKDKVFTNVKLYIENHRKAGKLEFLPHFSTYLNQKRYLDELPYASNRQGIDWE